MLQCSGKFDQQDETMNFSERIRALLKTKPFASLKPNSSSINPMSSLAVLVAAQWR